jgi:predicted metalloprotease with PDZ domain
MQFSRTSVAARLFIFLCLFSSACFAQDAIRLTVDATQVARKVLRAKIVFPVKSGPMTVYYPKWIPGDHSPDGPITNIAGLKFEAGGKIIPWHRDDLDVYAFHVDVPAGADNLQVSYDYIEPENMSATDKLLILEWNEVALYPAGKLPNNLSYEATLLLPDGWSFGTPLDVANRTRNSVLFKPVSLERLVDSPVIAGEYYRSIDITPTGEPIHHEIDMVADSEAALAMSPEI